MLNFVGRHKSLPSAQIVAERTNGCAASPVETVLSRLQWACLCRRRSPHPDSLDEWGPGDRGHTTACWALPRPFWAWLLFFWIRVHGPPASPPSSCLNCLPSICLQPLKVGKGAGKCVAVDKRRRDRGQHHPHRASGAGQAVPRRTGTDVGLNVRSREWKANELQCKPPKIPPPQNETPPCHDAGAKRGDG